LKNTNWPQRIVCLTEETTELLYSIGEEHRIVGISGFTVRPARARKEKPKVSAFTSAKIDKILDLKPDLVLGFSDLQADIAAELIKHGVEVYVFNQRSLADISRMMRALGRLIDAGDKTERFVTDLEDNMTSIRNRVATYRVRPKVYFEEWFDPIISGIGWVSEIIELCGGEDCFAENAKHQGGAQRIVADPLTVVERHPDIILGSWCGRRFHPHKVGERPGWEQVPAVLNNDIHEIKSSIILQPGPAALSDGLTAIDKIISQWVTERS
jgi:iron complex transport system substrate-binding protein